MVDVTARRGHQTTIRTHRLNTAIDNAIQILIKLNSVVGVTQNAGVRLNAVRDISVGKGLTEHHRFQGHGVVRNGLFNQLEQINELVITPVTNIRPGVFRLGALPVDPLSGNSVRIVAIRCRRIDEL